MMRTYKGTIHKSKKKKKYNKRRPLYLQSLHFLNCYSSYDMLQNMFSKNVWNYIIKIFPSKLYSLNKIGVFFISRFGRHLVVWGLTTIDWE